MYQLKTKSTWGEHPKEDSRVMRDEIKHHDTEMKTYALW